MAFELLQVTAAYSNAVLVAIMPHISGFAKTLELPIPQPVTIAQVRHFGCSPRADHIGGQAVLTNNYSFTYDHGSVILYRSPHSYYSLQDPNRVSEFYGPVKLHANEVVQIARNVLKKLGYTDSELHYNESPKVKPPLKNNGAQIARYLIEWREPDLADPGKFGIAHDTAIVEVDAATGQIQMLGIPARNARRPDPTIGVHPPVMTPPPKSELAGEGTRMDRVSEAYANVFLAAILPQLNDYAKKAGLEIKTPISANDVERSHYECWRENGGNIIVVLYLKTGDRFYYSHGQVIEFDAADAIRWSAPNSPPEDKPLGKYYGAVAISADEALACVKKAVKQLGFESQISRLKAKPEIVPPRKDGTNYLARYFFNWWQDGVDLQIAVAEVNATTKKLESLYINDHANTNVWRTPPEVVMPLAPIPNDFNH